MEAFLVSFIIILLLCDSLPLRADAFHYGPLLAKGFRKRKPKGAVCARLPGGHLTHGVNLNLLIAVEFAEPAVVPIHRLHCADLILGQAVGYEPITANCHTLQRNWHMLLTNPEEAARADHEVLLAVRPFHNALDIAKLIALRVVEIQLLIWETVRACAPGTAAVV